MAQLTLQVCLFGIVGILCRWGIDVFIQSQFPHDFPLGTLVINILGSFIIGLIFFKTFPLKLPLIVGLLGGFTTFSGLSIQAFQLLQSGSWGLGLFYLYGSPSLGLGAAWLGYQIAK
jgi:fluoride exporter